MKSNSPAKSKANYQLVRLLLLTVIFLFLINRLFSNLASHPFQTDEHEYIRKTYLFDKILQGDFNRDVWSTLDSYDQPALPVVIFGLPLRLIGITDITKHQLNSNFNLGWDGTYSDIYNQDNQWWSIYSDKPLTNPPSYLTAAFNLIVIGRYVSVLFTVGSIILLFIIGSRLGGWLLGAISMVLFAIHPVTFLLARRATSDSILMFFILAAILSLLLSLRKQPFSLVFPGIFTGLAAATKLNGFMLLLPFSLILFFDFVRKNYSFKQFITSLLTIFVTSALVFFLFNPYLYSQPLKNTFFMFQHRFLQGERFRSFSPDSLLNRFQAAQWLLQQFFVSLSGLLTISGLIIVIAKKQSFVFIWFLTFFLVMILYLPTTWSRYLFPLLPSTLLLQAYSLTYLVDRVKYTHANPKR